MKGTLVLFAALLLTEIAKAWDVPKVSGIWKLSTKALPRVEPTIIDRALGKVESQIRGANKIDGFLLKLNQDGTFRQCDEGYTYVEGASIWGVWSLPGEEKIKFVLNRQYYGPAYDIVMEGELQQTEDCLVAEGNLCKGRVTLPRSDPNFFRDGFSNAKILGPFRMIQSVTAVNENEAPFRDGALLEDDGVFQ